MGGQVLETVIAGVVTFLVGWLLWLLQRGGRRRRLRQSISDDLDLIEKLRGDRFAVARQRLEWKVQFGLEREYAPDPFGETRPTPQSRLSWAWWATALVGFSLAVVLISQTSGRWWVSLAAGATAGTLASIVSAVQDRFRLLREEHRLFLAFVEEQMQRPTASPEPSPELAAAPRSGSLLGRLMRLLPPGRR